MALTLNSTHAGGLGGRVVATLIMRVLDKL